MKYALIGNNHIQYFDMMDGTVIVLDSNLYQNSPEKMRVLSFDSKFNVRDVDDQVKKYILQVSESVRNVIAKTREKFFYATVGNDVFKIRSYVELLKDYYLDLLVYSDTYVITKNDGWVVLNSLMLDTDRPYFHTDYESAVEMVGRYNIPETEIIPAKDWLRRQIEGIYLTIESKIKK